ncbi:MAG: transcription antitermination factor NusB [Phycisphaerales bacterium]|nr:MAG: transcription antitermination factor NusB [Phycisphaerales bacterium]
MNVTRDVRRCALQAMYQFDAGSSDSPDIVRESLELSPGGEQSHHQGFDLAQAAWAARERADQDVAAITPDWPTYRQPMLDRNILRLAHHEITTGRTPAKAAINEAVELAKEFSTDKSPLFINGVLDKIYRLHLARTEAAEASAAGGDMNGEE